jgi:hypothetical protein
VMRSVFSFVLVSCLVAGTTALAADTGVSGKWKLTSQTPRGERTSEITLVQSGEKLTVTQKDREGKDVTSQGSVKGSDITWTTKSQGPNGEFVVTYKGKTAGKTMSGTSESDRGTNEWKAERVPQ